MVGGVVIEVVHVPSERLVWINCGGTGLDYRETLAVYTLAWGDGDLILPGDTVWWQGDSIYWTTRDRSRADVKLPKMSGSGVNRPKTEPGSNIGTVAA
jgi:hypothetical protein